MLIGKSRKQVRAGRGILSVDRLKMKQLSLRQKLDFVKGLFESWRNQEFILLDYPNEKLDGNVDLLSELTEQTFKSDLDMKRKVESWIEETEMRLKTQEEKREKYNKARFKKELFEMCLSRYKRKKK